MGRETVEVGDLEVGKYVIVNEEPCVVTKMISSDGDSTEKIYVEGLFHGQRRNFVMSLDEQIEVPVIEEGRAQILAIIGNSAQLLDLSTYETFELSIPLEFRGELEEGDEVEYIKALGRKKLRERGERD